MVTAEWTFADEEEPWSSSFLSSGRLYQYPLLIHDSEPLSVEDIRTILGPDDDIPQRLQSFKDQEFDDKLTWEVNCEDVVGNEYIFGDNINVIDSFDRSDHISTISELELMQERNIHLESIQEELRHQNSPLGEY